MNKEVSSFRDKDSNLFFDEEYYYRQLSPNYLPNFSHFKKSGLYDKLEILKLILPFEEIESNDFDERYSPLILKSRKLPFISYPYEWSFSQLKSAALLTLNINLIALEYGMILKDSSAYNIQFIGSRAVFIDITSFELYNENCIWSGYHQFCKHFLAPLYLSSQTDLRLVKLLLSNIDGIDLDLTRKLLPFKSFFSVDVFLHLYLNTFKIGNVKSSSNLKKSGLSNIITHLVYTINKLELKNKKSKWANYYNNSNYLEAGNLEKNRIVKQFISKLDIKTALDIGANDGRFSRLLSEKSIYTISSDSDEVAIELNFENSKNDDYLHTLFLDFANPTPGIGWDNIERKSFNERANFDLILALAVIHHLVIYNDLTFEMVAESLSKICKYLIIEFPDPLDEKVVLISNNKSQQYKSYTLFNFKLAFEKYFIESESRQIQVNNRLIFLYVRKD